MVLFGSRTRSKEAADAYSDCDIILFVKDVSRFVNTDEWLHSIAPYYISFSERAAAQDYERRVFFDDAAD